MKKWDIRLCILAGAILLIIGPLRADVTVGSPGDAGAGDCAPFGCPNDSVYQQIYASGVFSGGHLHFDLLSFRPETHERHFQNRVVNLLWHRTFSLEQK